MITGKNADKAFETIDQLIINPGDVQRLGTNQNITFCCKQ